MRRIVEGLHRFQTTVFPTKRDLFRTLADSQAPRALFITCGDSRIVPDLITQTNPGELFICRNAGNIVPPFGEVAGGVSATIEYAVVALEIPDIIVCGHSDCGAMKGILYPETTQSMPMVAHWLRHAEPARCVVEALHSERSEHEKLEILTQENVLAQLQNLLTHPSVAARLARGTLNVHGWHYDISTGGVVAFDAARNRFVRLEPGDRIPSATPRPRHDVD
jgi:carbonic anhydrase